MVIPVRAEDAGGEVRPVRAVGEMLGLQAKTPVLAVYGTGLAGKGVQEVPRVELKAGLGGKDPHGPARGGFKNFRTGPQLARLAPQDKAVVVAPSGGPEVPAYGLGDAEVKGPRGRRKEGSGGDQGGIHLHVGGRIEPDLVAEDRAPAFPGEVEVGVVGEVHRAGGVHSGGIVRHHLVAPGEAVADHGLEVARKSLLPVGAAEFKADKDAVPLLIGIGLPQEFVESPQPPVEGVGPVVPGKLVDRTVQGKAASPDAVGVAPDGAPQVGLVVGVPLQGGVAQEDIPGGFSPGRNDEGNQGCPEVRYGQGQFPRFQGIEVGLFPRGEEPEGFLGDLHRGMIAEKGEGVKSNVRNAEGENKSFKTKRWGKSFY